MHADIFHEPFDVDPISASLIETIFGWKAAGCPTYFRSPAVNHTVRFSITTPMKSADGEYVLPEVKKEDLEGRPGGNGVWWSKPKPMGHPLEVLWEVLDELRKKKRKEEVG